MNKVMETIIDEIDQKFECLQIDFKDNSWRRSIPSEPGWYLIKTNTPIHALKSVGAPKPENKAHINIPETINNTSMLQDSGIAIMQSGDEDYVVYNGEAENLKARAREDVRGSSRTYCLGLSKYKTCETLHRYRWAFCYVAVSSCKSVPNVDKLLRLAVEQGWRAKNGWPVLCRK